MRRTILALLLPALLSACIFGGGDDDEDRRRIRPSASGPVTLNSKPSRETRQCYAALDRDRIEYRKLPDRDYGGGCVVIGAVQLLDIGVPVENITAMRCPLAQRFTAWVRHAVAPAAHQILGSDLVRVESMGTYACRAVVGNSSGRLSEHALANAVDVAVFVLEDGRRISVQNGWNSDEDDVRRFMRVIHKSACRRFDTVLSPDYNAAHYNHFHLDMGRGPFCR